MLEKLALNALKARDLARSLGIVPDPQTDWKWATKRLLRLSPDYAENYKKTLAKAKESMGLLPNNLKQRLDAKSALNPDYELAAVKVNNRPLTFPGGRKEVNIKHRERILDEFVKLPPPKPQNPPKDYKHPKDFIQEYYHPKIDSELMPAKRRGIYVRDAENQILDGPLTVHTHPPSELRTRLGKNLSGLNKETYIESVKPSSADLHSATYEAARLNKRHFTTIYTPKAPYQHVTTATPNNPSKLKNFIFETKY